jgi:1-deoxy-D-xylulose-5-phosphate synthase
VEDGCIQGGMGSAIIEFMADHGYTAQVKRLGIPDEYIEHGTQDELYAECGFDVAAMVRTALEMCQVRSKQMLGAS